MVQAFLILVGLQILGDLIVRATGILIPGSVIGMALLFAILLLTRKLPESLDKGAGQLLAFLGLLFVPAGVGIVNYLDLLQQKWEMIFVASVSATIVTLIVTGLIYQIMRKNESHD